MIKSILPVFVLVCFSFSVTSMAKDLGVFGAVYDITEKDALKEIEEKAREVDINRIMNKGELARKVKNYTPEDSKDVKLPPARRDRTFLVDMTYTLDRDIADERGNVIYPKGYTFNPLDYVTYPGVIVILDGKSPAQVAWFKQSAYSKDLKTKLLVTDGSYAELSRTLKRPVFYVSQVMVGVFQIQAVPSVVRQRGVVMEVKEIPPTLSTSLPMVDRAR
jgi:conjugal transfer pilus assembly protein TraW